MTARITVRVEGIQALLRDLRDDPVYAKPWIDALKAASELAAAGLKRHVPGGRGADIKVAIQKADVPKWGRARMPSRRRGKFRYLGALHGSRRIAFRYRTGPFRGQRTRDWFEKARASVRDRIVALITAAERKIESQWGGR